MTTSLASDRPSVAFGPVAPEFGSWNWLGADLATALASEFLVATFTDSPPPYDVVVYIKFKPPLARWRELAQRARVVYCPVDVYGSAAEIDADWESLRLCHHIITHCERLTKYFSPYAPTTYLDHHLKYVAPPPTVQRTDGPVVWIGNRANLPPLVEWWRRRAPPDELWLLTDSVTDADLPTAADCGLNSGDCRIARWTPERHITWTALARGAIEIKGDDFRSRHKSPAKAQGFIASGIPLAMNGAAAATEHLRSRGFTVTAPEDRDYWWSHEYWELTQRFGRNLEAQLSLRQVAERFCSAALR
jgi:hypothetical protein